MRLLSSRGLCLRAKRASYDLFCARRQKYAEAMGLVYLQEAKRHTP